MLSKEVREIRIRGDWKIWLAIVAVAHSINEKKKYLIDGKECKVVPTRIGWFLEYNLPFKYGIPYDTRMLCHMGVLCVQRAEFRIEPYVENMRRYLKDPREAHMFIADVLESWDEVQDAVIEAEVVLPEQVDGYSEVLSLLRTLAKDRYRIDISESLLIEMATTIAYVCEKIGLHTLAYSNSVFAGSMEYHWW